MYEYLLFITYFNTSNPNMGRFATLQECQYVGRIYATDNAASSQNIPQYTLYQSYKA